MSGWCGEAAQQGLFRAVAGEGESAQFGCLGQLAAAELDQQVGADGAPLLTDGPCPEASEVLGGYAEVEVADLDEALRMAKTWPPKGAVEVRPVLEQP